MWYQCRRFLKHGSVAIFFFLVKNSAKLTGSRTQDGGCTIADRLVDAPITAGGAGSSDGHICDTAGNFGSIASNGKNKYYQFAFSGKRIRRLLTFHQRSILHSYYLLKSKSTISKKKKPFRLKQVKRTGSCGREINTNYLG